MASEGELALWVWDDQAEDSSSCPVDQDAQVCRCLCKHGLCVAGEVCNVDRESAISVALMLNSSSVLPDIGTCMTESVPRRREISAAAVW